MVPPRRLDQLGVEVGDGREPVLEVVVEHVLRLPGLEVEEAEDERAGKAEERGRERRAHAAQRRGEAGLEVLEDDAGVAGGDVERSDGVADGR